MTSLLQSLRESEIGIGSHPSRNLFHNPEFTQVNQRDFAGGALASGNRYGYDMWRNGAGNANYSWTGDLLTLTGEAIQIIESPGLAGQYVTVSAEDVGINPLAVYIDDPILGGGGPSVSGSIFTGAGRKATTLLIPAGLTGNLRVYLYSNAGGATTVSFRRPQIEVGKQFTPFVRRPTPLELDLCQYYYFRKKWSTTASYVTVLSVFSTVGAWGAINIPRRMRAIPTVASSAPGHFALNDPGGNSGNRQALTTFSLNANENSVQISNASVGGAAISTAGYSSVLQAINNGAWIEGNTWS
jgi:hypothetical protein